MPDDVKTRRDRGDHRHLEGRRAPQDRQRSGRRATTAASSCASRPGVAQARRRSPHTDVPKIAVNKLAKSEKINIDGKLDDEAWKGAASTGPFVDVGTGNAEYLVPGERHAPSSLWDDTNLYVGFDVKDPDVIGGFPKDAKDPHLWTKDTVEIMIDPDGDGDNNDYYEIQVNPQNLVFDTQYDGYNTPKTEPHGPFGHEDWSAKLKSAVSVDGTIDKPGDKDEGYVVEPAIPWASFSKAKNHPPKPGDAWRMNFYAMKNNCGVAWSPILGQGNFHKATRFGRVRVGNRRHAGSSPIGFGRSGFAGGDRSGYVGAGWCRPGAPRRLHHPAPNPAP